MVAFIGDGAVQALQCRNLQDHSPFLVVGVLMPAEKGKLYIYINYIYYIIYIILYIYYIIYIYIYYIYTYFSTIQSIYKYIYSIIINWNLHLIHCWLNWHLESLHITNYIRYSKNKLIYIKSVTFYKKNKLQISEMMN